MATSKPIGPGPGAYQLPTNVGHPDHDARKYRNPMYSFGIATSTIDKRVSPGPGAYFPTKITRHGPESIPKWTLYQRLDPKMKSKGPGPGAHNILEHPNFKVNAPAYSMAAILNFKNKQVVPAPNAYMYGVGSVKPSIPAYSLGIKKDLINKEKNPGPAAYGPPNMNVNLKKSPAYTMRPQIYEKSKAIGPGPSHYNRSEYKPGDSSAAYSFGIKHHQYAPPMIVECD